MATTGFEIGSESMQKLSWNPMPVLRTVQSWNDLRRPPRVRQRLLASSGAVSQGGLDGT